MEINRPDNLPGYNNQPGEQDEPPVFSDEQLDIMENEYMDEYGEILEVLEEQVRFSPSPRKQYFPGHKNNTVDL